MLQIAAHERLFKLDYAEVIDESDFAIATQSTSKQRAIIAGWLNGVRLIDNMEMNLSSKTPGAR
jgi:pantoate--beta-alanine ligase